MGYPPKLVANTVLKRAFRDRVPVNPMKLQRILYFLAAEYGKAAGRPLMNIPFRPWPYGPVQEDVHQAFKCFASDPVTSYAKDPLGQGSIIRPGSDTVLEGVLEQVWRRTRRLSSAELAKASVLPGSAWHQAMESGAGSLDDEVVAADFTYRIPLGLVDGVPAGRIRGFISRGLGRLPGR